MTLAPLLFACVLAPQEAPPPDTGPGLEAPAAAAGAALRQRAAAALDAALDAPLSAPVTVRAGDTLADALDQVAEQLPGVSVRPDTRRLDLEGLDLRDLPLRDGLSLPAGRFPVRTAFEELLNATGDVPLALWNDGGLLKVTTQDFADEWLTTRVYPVRDLLEAAAPTYAQRHPGPWVGGGGLGGGGLGGGDGGAGMFSLAPAGPLPAVANQFCLPSPQPPVPQPPAEPQSPRDAALEALTALYDVITYTTGGVDNGGGWGEIDGEGGSIEDFDGTLVVRQTEAVHRQIAALLADLRTAAEVRPWTLPAELPAPADGGSPIYFEAGGDAAEDE